LIARAIGTSKISADFVAGMKFRRCRQYRPLPPTFKIVASQTAAKPEKDILHALLSIG
jgi:hypothetical protein